VGDVFSALFQNVYACGFRLSPQKRLKACLTHGYAGMRFARNYLFEDALPSVHVRAHIIKPFTVDFDVQRRNGRAIQNGVENDVFAQAVREEETGDDAFVNDV